MLVVIVGTWRRVTAVLSCCCCYICVFSVVVVVVVVVVLSSFGWFDFTLYNFVLRCCFACCFAGFVFAYFELLLSLALLYVVCIFSMLFCFLLLVHLY